MKMALLRVLRPVVLFMFVAMILSPSYAMFYRGSYGPAVNMARILALQQNRINKHRGFYKVKAALLIGALAWPAKASLQEEGAQDKGLAALARKHGFIYLKHMTSVDRLKEILDSKMLLSAKETGHEDNGPLGEVYMALEPINMNRMEDYIPCILFFSLNLLDERADYHVTNGWVYGRYFNPDPSHSLLSARPDEHEKLEKILTKIFSAPGHHGEGGEVVFKGSVDLHLVEKIYVGGGRDLSPEERKSLIAKIEQAGISVGTVGRVISWHPNLLEIP